MLDLSAGHVTVDDTLDAVAKMHDVEVDDEAQA